MADPRKTVKLKSSDGVEIVVSESVAKQSKIIRLVIEDAGTENTIPLTTITAKTLEKVTEFCNGHAEAAQNTGVSSEEDLKKWDHQFLDVHQDILFDLFAAAKYLDISTLTHAISQKIADMIKGKTAEEIRQMFTPEEDEEIVQQDGWAF